MLATHVMLLLAAAAVAAGAGQTRDYSYLKKASSLANLKVLGPRTRRFTKPATSTSGSSRPNIILILTDDMGFNDIGYHNPNVSTPTIDRLAREGVILEQAYSMPSCSPSRSALMTGIYPYKYGRQGLPIPHNSPSGLPLNLTIMPQYFRQLNYSTHLVGKWHLGFCKEAYLPTRRGFDTSFGYWSGFTDPISKQTAMNYYPNNTGYMFNDDDNVVPPSSQHIDDMMAERVEQIINKQAAENAATPFFLYLAPLSPHFPTLTDDYSRLEVLTALNLLDNVVARVVAALKQTGLYDNTVIAFSSDNGGDPNFGGSNLPLRGKKETLWEGGLRVPAFIHSPLLFKNGGKGSADADSSQHNRAQTNLPHRPSIISDQLFHITDWLPTLLRAAGVSDTDMPPNIDGINQWDALQTTAGSGAPHFVPPRTEIPLNLLVNQYGRLEAAYRQGRFKIIIHQSVYSEGWIEPLPPCDRQDLAGRAKLFNVVKDPSERVDLAAQRPKITQRLAKRVEELRKSMKPPRDEPLIKAGIKDGVWVTGWC